MRRVEIEEYKDIVVNIMIKVDKICRDNGIKYMLFFGTLLGAVRHKGFIPWDDDIDIVVKREDYYKLEKLINSNNFDLNFISVETNRETIFPYGKICDNKTVVIEQNFKKINDYGAFIDVFPLDYLPENERTRKRLIKQGRVVRRIIVHSARTGYTKSESKKVNLMRNVAMRLCSKMNTYKLVKQLSSPKRTKTHDKTNYLGISWERSFLAEDLKDVSEVTFEGHSFLAPKDTDKILKELYGDYMKLPPENERVSNHTLECYVKEK